MIKRVIGSLFSAFGLVVVGLAFTAALAGPASAAGTGYVPTPPPVTPPAPSSICSTGAVVTSSTVGAAGGTVSGTVGTSGVTVSVPAGDFSGGAQVAILSTSGITVPNPDVIVLSFAVNFCENGAKVTGTFPVPVTVTVTDPAIKPGQTLFIVTPGGLVPVPTASIGTGSFTLTITGDPEFVLVSATTTVIPGATTVVTGKPFLLEGIVAGGLVLVGSLLLLRLRFRHH